MADIPHHLLTPTLSSQQRQVRLYSPTALFYTSFFGGPVAAIAFSVLNSKQLDRVDEDRLWYVLAGVAALAWIVGSVYVVRLTDVIPLDFFGDADRTGRYVIRAFGLALWGAFYFMHRSFHRANSLVGAEPLGPWKAAIGCIIGASIVQGVVVNITLSALG